MIIQSQNPKFRCSQPQPIKICIPGENLYRYKLVSGRHQNLPTVTWPYINACFSLKVDFKRKLKCDKYLAAISIICSPQKARVTFPFLSLYILPWRQLCGVQIQVHNVCIHNVIVANFCIIGETSFLGKSYIIQSVNH